MIGTTECPDIYRYSVRINAECIMKLFQADY